MREAAYLLHLPESGDRAAPVLGVAPHGEAEGHGEDDEAECGARETCSGREEESDLGSPLSSLGVLRDVPIPH